MGAVRPSATILCTKARRDSRPAFTLAISPRSACSSMLGTPQWRTVQPGHPCNDLFAPSRTALRNGVNATLDEKAADLVDDGGAPADKARAHAMQRQKIALLMRLDCNEVHGRPLYRLGDGFSIAIVVLVPGRGILRIGLHAGVARRVAEPVDPRRLIEAAQERGKLRLVLAAKPRNIRPRGAGLVSRRAELDDRRIDAHGGGRLSVWLCPPATGASRPGGDAATLRLHRRSEKVRKSSRIRVRWGDGDDSCFWAIPSGRGHRNPIPRF